MFLLSTAETCKKRWKYLRERYVQQKKTGDSPNYEHLSRPYLEKMRFLDNFIQPRKSYRNVSHLLQSPNHSQHSLMDGINGVSGNDDGCIDRRLEQKLQISHIMQQFHNHMLPDAMTYNGGGGGGGGGVSATNGDHNALQMSSENMSFFEQYSNNFQPHHNHQHPHQSHSTPLSHGQLPHQQHQHQQHVPNTSQSCRQNSQSDASLLLASNSSSTTSEAAVPNSDPSQLTATPVDGAIKHELPQTTGSSSSSLASSMASPLNGSSHHHDTLNDSSRLTKRRRSSVSIPPASLTASNNTHSASVNKISTTTTSSNNINLLSEDDDDEDDRESPNNGVGGRMRSPSFPTDFLYPFYQHATSHAQHQRQQQQHLRQQTTTTANVAVPPVRNSEQLLGELVTSELLKMSKERRKVAQKKILKVLFFDD